MHRLSILLIALVFLAGVGLWAATETDQKIKRTPLEKSGTPIKAPATYEKRTRVESGRPVTYDPKPRVEVVDERAGKYEFRWIGYDGREKVVAYQRPDAIDVIVSGSVEKSADGDYIYSYVIDMLPSSAANLYSFGLQNFSDDTRPVEINEKRTELADLRVLKNFSRLPDDGKPKNFETTIFFGEMSNAIHRFREGNWIAFGILPDFESQVGPGGRLRVKLSSKAAPGLVECSAVAGPRTMKGAGEHMPSELEEIIPGYQAWPSGHTVGPVASLNSLTQDERVNYLLDKMIQFEKLGWITPSARRWYEKNFSTTSSQRKSAHSKISVQSRFRLRYSR
jgi:hypothetical protein